MGISAVVGAASVGLGAYGLYERQQGNALSQQGAQSQYQAAQQQSALSAEYATREAGIRTGEAAASVTAAQSSRDINVGIIQGQQDIEGLRRRAMEMDARRQNLEILRNQQRVRSVSLTGATRQGANFAGSTALGGAYGQSSGQTGTNLQGVQNNLLIGSNIFDINANISNQKIAFADLQNTYAQQQAGFTTQHSNLMAEYAQRQVPIQNLSSYGGSLVAQGQGMSSMGQGFMQAGSSLWGAYSSFNQIAPSFNNYFSNPGFGTQAYNPARPGALY